MESRSRISTFFGCDAQGLGSLVVTLEEYQNGTLGIEEDRIVWKDFDGFIDVLQSLFSIFRRDLDQDVCEVIQGSRILRLFFDNQLVAD